MTATKTPMETGTETAGLRDPLERRDPSTADRGAEERRRVRIRTFRSSDAAELAAAALAGLALTWLLFFRLTPLTGPFGFAVVWYLSFLLTYALVEREGHGALLMRDRLATVVMSTAGFLAVVPLMLIIGLVVAKGAGKIRLNTFTETLQFTGPADPATAGGLLHAIVGTVEQVGIALVVSVPLAILTAVHLNEIGGRLARVVRLFVDAMSGVPSIVAGLFIYSLVIIQLGQGFSGLAAALALSVLMLPTVTRTSEEMLRLVPGGLREAALALGSPEWRVTTRVVLPTARVGLVTAAILGTARVVGETAPALLTSFGASVLNASPFSAPQENLPLAVFRLIRSSQDAQVDRGWVASFVLLALVLALFVTARVVGNSTRSNRSGSSPPRLSRLRPRLPAIRRTS